MAPWDRKDLDLLGPACLTLDRSGQGTMRFVAIEASVDYRPGVRDRLPAIDFPLTGMMKAIASRDEDGRS
jgi:hypothetical protein